MKKTSNHTSDSSEELPIIKIVSEEEEMHVKLGLEMEDSTHDVLVKWGKEVATDEDYLNIAVQAGLREYADSIEE
jgi:hypothetical protein